MNLQEAREAPISNRTKEKQQAIWFQPKTLYLLLGMVLLIALIGTFMSSSVKRGANDIISPFDGANAPPQTPDRSAIVLQTAPKAEPATQGAGPQAAPGNPQPGR